MRVSAELVLHNGIVVHGAGFMLPGPAFVAGGGMIASVGPCGTASRGRSQEGGGHTPG